MVDIAHSFHLLLDVFFEVRVLRAALQAQALYRIETHRIGKFAGQDHMPIAAFSDFPNGLIVPLFKDLLRLLFKTAAQHLLIYKSYQRKIILILILNLSPRQIQTTALPKLETGYFSTAIWNFPHFLSRN